jgi:hypothetical protein
MEMVDAILATAAHLAPDVRLEEADGIAHFLVRLYEATSEDEHPAVDEVFNFMDDHLLAGRFSVCDLALATIDPDKLLPSVVVSLLMVTRRAKEKLPSRQAFLSRAVAAVAGRDGLEEAEALLGKYR